MFSVKPRPGSGKSSGARASAAPIGAGDVIVSSVNIASDGVTAQRTRDVGDVGMLELEGIFLGLEDGELSLAVEKRGAVRVAVPADLTTQAPAFGTELEVLVSIASDGGFTLVAFADEDGGIDFDHENGEIEVEGVLSALTDSSVSVRGSGGVALSCSIPTGAVLTGFAVGDEVELKCAIGADGAFSLRELASGTAEFEIEDEDDDEGEGEDDA